MRELSTCPVELLSFAATQHHQTNIEILNSLNSVNLRAYENKVLRRIFRPNNIQEVTEDEENYSMSNFIIFNLHQILLGLPNQGE
jgi:hypothetical protein